MDLLAQQRAEREARILDAARELIERVGYQNVTIRDLAAESRVSVPTLYKLFGDKNALLRAAVEDRFAAVLRFIERDPALEGLELAIALVEGCSRELLRTTSYSKAVLAAFMGADQAGELSEMVARELTAELETALLQMRETDQLEAWADPRALAERLASHQIMVCLEWQSGHLKSRSMTSAMLFGLATILLGVSRGAATRRLKSLAMEVQNLSRADGGADSKSKKSKRSRSK